MSDHLGEGNSSLAPGSDTGAREPVPSRRRRGEWLAGLFILGLTVCWCFAAGRAIYYQGDYMIGFHPLLLLLLPFGGCLFLGAVVTCVLQRWRLGGPTALSFVLVVAFFSQGYRLGQLAWKRSIRRYDAANQQAIRQNTDLPELTDDTVFDGVFSDDALPVLQGFQWYCEHHLASPDNSFRAFRFRGVVHVRIRKVRHGYRGIVLVPSPAHIQNLETDARLIYEEDRLIAGQWQVWRTD